MVLDTFPAGGWVNSLQAFSVGAPVVTLPGQYLAGRLTLAMYEKMGMPRDCCVASDPREYVNLALQLAHNQQLRSRLVSRILASNYRLFEDERAVDEWDRFLSAVVPSGTSRGGIEVVRGLSNDTVTLQEVGEMDLGEVHDQGDGQALRPPVPPAPLLKSKLPPQAATMTPLGTRHRSV